jgi:hypothetical protein
MERDYEKEIKEIVGDLECPKDFRCYRSGFEIVCEARGIGLETLLECLEENPLECKFSMSFGYSYLCQCPLRFFIYEKLKK